MFNMQVPILMYHEVTIEAKLEQVGKQTKYTYIVTKDQFETQMQWLAEAGYTTILLDTIIEMIENKNSLRLPPKSIVITFDDGFAGNHQYALPILKNYGHSAVFFITVNKIGTPYMMDWKQLNALVSAGMSVQSHSMTHSLLGQLDEEGVHFELKESRQVLQHRLQTRVDFLSLPDGSYNKYYKDAAIESGYRGGCVSHIGFVHPSCDPFFLNRIVVDRNYDLEEFKSIAETDPEFIKKIASKRKYKDLLLKIIGEKYYNQLFRFIYRSND